MTVEQAMQAEVRGFTQSLEACAEGLSAMELAFLKGILSHAGSIRREDVPEYTRLVSSIQSCLSAHVHHVPAPDARPTAAA